MRILFYLLICVSVLQCKITIKDAGVATLNRGDVGMIFYVTLNNIGASKLHVFVKMNKCCERFDKDDMDCQMMHLMGGDMGLIYPNRTKNISLIYPNMYLHNRKGQCIIDIKYKGKENCSHNVKHNVKFDTYIYGIDATPPVLQDYYSKNEVSTCNTLDEDPLEQCEPVDCHMKYLGNRNFFNWRCHRCEKVPICVADPEKDTPDVSYYPTSNRCRDLDLPISVEDLKKLECSGDVTNSESNFTSLFSVNLYCHHGVMNNETGFCDCDSGWMSAPSNNDQFEPSLFIYHMCNIEMSTWNNIHTTKIRMTFLIIAILGALFAVLLVMLSCTCHVLYKCIVCDYAWSKERKSSSEDDSSKSSTNKTTMCQKVYLLLCCKNKCPSTSSSRYKGESSLSRSVSDIENFNQATSPRIKIDTSTSGEGFIR